MTAMLLMALQFSLPGRAQGLDAQLFDPSPGATTFMEVVDSREFDVGLGTAAFFDLASRPLVFNIVGEQIAIVDRLGVFDFQAFGGSNHFHVGVDLPFYLLSDGEASSPTSLGDVSVLAQNTVVDRLNHRVGFGWYGRASIPTGNPDVWQGEGKPTAEAGLGLSAGHAHSGSLNVGLGTAGNAILGGMAWGNRVTWGAGAAFFQDSMFGLTVELTGLQLLSSTAATSHPMEGIAALRFTPTPGASIRLGVGKGLTNGVGCPIWRAVAALSFHTGSHAGPRLPDVDRDGVIDGLDLCPDHAEDPNGQADHDGCPDQDTVQVTLDAQDSSGRRLEILSTAHLGLTRFQGASELPLWPETWALRVGSVGYEYQDFNLVIERGTNPGVHLRLGTVNNLEQVGDPARMASPPVLPTAALRPADQDADGRPDISDDCADQPEDENGVEDQDGCPDAFFCRLDLSIRDDAGNLAEGARIAFYNGPTSGTWSATDGTLVRAFLPGTYKVRVSAPALLAVEQEIVVPPTPRIPMEFVLRNPVPVDEYELDVVRADGSPFTDATLWLVGPVRAQARTDTQGKIRVPLGEGAYEARVFAPGMLTWRDQVEITAVSHRRARVVLEPMAPSSLDQAVPIRQELWFEAPTTVVLHENLTALRQIADTLHAWPQIRRLSLEGFVPGGKGSLGDDRYSLAMAEAVRTWLIENEGIETDRISTLGHGSRLALDVPADTRPWVKAWIAIRVDSGNSVK